ncbi:MAG TPA: hypothetical protein PKA20_26485 [Burkholderiaceae bacterium]|nr:hypothetical protein [Burkholderiaceae bacterium]
MYEFLVNVLGRYALPAGGLISLVPVMFANWCMKSSLLGRKGGTVSQLLAALLSALTSPFPMRWTWIPFVVAGIALPFLKHRPDPGKDSWSKADLFGSVVLLLMSLVLAVSYLWFGLLSNAHDQRLAGADMIVSALAFIVAWRRWTIISPQ